MRRAQVAQATGRRATMTSLHYMSICSITQVIERERSLSSPGSCERGCRSGQRIGMVGDTAVHVVGVVLGLAEQRGHVMVVQRVVDDVAFATRLDQPPV